jgi:hypothetical protein
MMITSKWMTAQTEYDNHDWLGCGIKYFATGPKKDFFSSGVVVAK